MSIQITPCCLLAPLSSQTIETTFAPWGSVWYEGRRSRLLNESARLVSFTFLLCYILRHYSIVSSFGVFIFRRRPGTAMLNLRTGRLGVMESESWGVLVFCITRRCLCWYMLYSANFMINLLSLHLLHSTCRCTQIKNLGCVN